MRIVPLCALFLLAACGGGAEGGDPGAAQPTPDAGITTADPEPVDSPTATATSPGEAASGATSALQGETIEFVVPYNPGGGYDQYARFVAPYLADCLGAEIIVVNQPGAGSLLATNQTAVAEPDGRRIQILSGVGALGAQIAGAEGVQYDLAEMSWLARIAGEPSVLSVGANSGFEDVQDLIDAERPVRFTAVGPGSTEYIGATVLSEVYGIESEIVSGFAGAADGIAAIAAGDADAIVLALDSSMASIESGDLKPLAVVSEERSDTLPDVPTVYDYDVVDESQPEVLDAYVGLVEAARPVAGPPGLPEDVLASLRAAFECALSNEEFVATAEEAGRPVAPLSGEEIEAVIKSALDSPEAFRDLVRESFPQ